MIYMMRRHSLQICIQRSMQPRTTLFKNKYLFLSYLKDWSMNPLPVLAIMIGDIEWSCIPSHPPEVALGIVDFIPRMHPSAVIHQENRPLWQVGRPQMHR